jgi:beta-N-acetylhexosaminidase
MRKVRLPPGPAVVDVLGTVLTDEDRERIRHPAAGAVILFARNYENPEQLALLCEDIERQREPALPICVDHEGGRVQRFREGFTAIPPMREVGRLWDRDRERGREAAHAIGYVIGAELGAVGVDFTFAPVLDLDYGGSSVIGDRALHFDPTAVGALAAQLVRGLGAAGMAAVGKHFPGHGATTVDSHRLLPVVDASMARLDARDLAPFRAAIGAGLDAVMVAHLLVKAVDPGTPASLSPRVVGRLLRDRMGFDGLVVSDALEMGAIAGTLSVPAAAERSLAAGVDQLTFSGHTQVPAVLDQLAGAVAAGRLSRDRVREAFLRVQRFKRVGRWAGCR